MNESVDGAEGVDIWKDGEEKLSVGSELVVDVVVVLPEEDLRPVMESHLERRLDRGVTECLGVFTLSSWISGEVCRATESPTGCAAWP